MGYDAVDCYECSANGDDYYINSRGEMECYCSNCMNLSDDMDDDWDD